MLVNDADFPGPALWQGAMLCLLLPVVIAMESKNITVAKYALPAYIIVGIVLFFLLV